MINRLRIGAAITTILGIIYAFSGLMESLTAFGIGMAVAAAGVIGYGLCDVLQSDRDERAYRERVAVWHRRDLEQARRNATQVTNLYEYPRDSWY